MEGTYYEFRAPKCTEELEQLIRLRYRVYKESRLAHFTCDSDTGLDIDVFDLNSRHFGLFMVESHRVVPIGYHRIVEDRPGPQISEVQEIARQAGIHLPANSPDTPFPIMTYCPTAAAVKALYFESKSEGRASSEATKFALSKEHHSLALAKHMIESEVAIHMLHRKTDYAITCCTPVHSRFYSRYGFQQFPGTEDFVHEGVPGRCLLASIGSIPDGVLGRLRSMVEVYVKCGCICYNAAESDNFYGSKSYGATMQSSVNMAA